MTAFTESEAEDAALQWLQDQGWSVAHGPDIAHDGENPERTDYTDVVLRGRLRDALGRLNPGLPDEAIGDAYRKLTQPAGGSLARRNRDLHRLLVDGVTVEYSGADGVRGAQVRVIDYEQLEANDWLAVNQLTVREGEHRRRPDVVLFVNGLPLGVMELKNPANEDATVDAAWRQLQTYKAELADLFAFNAVLIASDGTEARVGTLTSGREWFKPWRTIAGEQLADTALPQLQVMIAGLCERSRFLRLLRHFIVFEDDGGGSPAKKMAGYHQFHAVEVAVQETLRAAGMLAGPSRSLEREGRYETRGQAAGEPGDRRIGVVWHTQGSGKSLTMAFYAGRIAREPGMENPTIVVLTDRNDLDDQLFGTFARCSDLIGQPPAQAADRADLRRKLDVRQGGVVFTTIQKFFPGTKGDQMPRLSERRNIVVIADEAHRSQYDFIDGFARHMRDALPNASFIGFTGTPIEKEDANTRQVFGDHISIYDIERAVLDKATVPIYYESRLAKLELAESARLHLDDDFEEVTEGEEAGDAERLKTKWAQLEAVAGAEPRLKLIAADVVEHFERRLGVMRGKAMLVCMSRRICVELYREIARLRPEWHHDDDAGGAFKVVMTGGASDPVDWQPHIRNKARREQLARRFRDPNDPLQMVLVRDMWLTGFDAPSLHTMYIDKPMRGHGLMQAIARVNRVFRDKPGGLVVDYIGIAHELKRALASYTQSGGQGTTTVDQSQAVDLLREKYEVCRDILHGFDHSAWTSGTSAERLGLLPGAQEHVLAQKDGKARFIKAVRELSQAFALAVPHEETTRIRDYVAFFQAVQAGLAKRVRDAGPTGQELDFAIRRILSEAVVSTGVEDIFAVAGLEKPDVSVLSEEFLAEVRRMKHRNLAVELLQRLIKGELRTRGRKNVVRTRSFAEMLDEAIRRYTNRAVEAAQVIEELIALAREVREADARGEALGLTQDELAFYEALETNDSAVQLLGDDVLCAIARELVEKVRKNVSIDWTIRANVRAGSRRLVKRILREHGYPPDRREAATRTVLEQAEALSDDWASSS